MNFQTLHKQRKFILIAAAAGIIAVFLPWISITVGMFGYSETHSTNGFRSYGIVVFLSFIVAGIAAFLGNQTAALEKTNWLVALVAGAAALLFTVIFMLSGSDATGGFGLADAHFGFGLWIALVASIAVILFGWMYRNPENNLKESFESIKKTIATTTAQNNTSQPKAPVVNMNKVDELERLITLKNNGSITEEEFQKMKANII